MRRGKWLFASKHAKACPYVILQLCFGNDIQIVHVIIIVIVKNPIGILFSSRQHVYQFLLFMVSTPVIFY